MCLTLFCFSSIPENQKSKPLTASVDDSYLPASKVIFIGAGDLQVQRAELVRVVLLPSGVVPRQGVELVPVERLPLHRVVGVHVDLPALQAGPEAELQLETWRKRHGGRRCLELLAHFML